MKKIQLLLGIFSVLSFSACNTLPQPPEVTTEVSTQAVRPARPPRPPRPPTTGVSNSVSVNCNTQNNFTNCEITINNVKYVRSYVGQVSTSVNNGVVQILQNGQVIDEIRP